LKESKLKNISLNKILMFICRMHSNDLFQKASKIFISVGAMMAGANLNFELLTSVASFQSFFLCFTAILFGAQIGLISQMAYLVLGLFFPVFASGLSGIAAFTAHTSGFLFAFPLAAYLVGRLSERHADWFSIFSFCVFGHFILMLSQFLWLVLIRKVAAETAIFSSMLNLLPWAFFKSTLVTALVILSQFFKIKFRKS